MNIDIADIPVAPADPEELRRCAHALRQAGAPLRLSAENILFSWGMLPEVYRAPESVDLQDSMTLIGPAAVEIITGIGLACTAVEALADELDAIDRERSALVTRIEKRFLPGLAERPIPDDPFAQRLAADARADAEAEFRRDCAALADRWDAAVDACAARLRAIPEIPWALSGRLRVDEQTLTAESTSITDAAALPLLTRLADRGGADAARLLAAHPEWVAVIRRAHPAAIAQWWNSLPPATTVALIAAMPAVIGNLDGVAIETRVAVNRVRAAARVEELRRQRLEAQLDADPLTTRFRSPSAQADGRLRAIDDEIAYFQAVQEGRKHLYAWDPDHGSLIEMSGDPSRATSALFVVPGTNTEAASFFGEKPVTRFADWQVNNARPSGEVLAFTVMTGPMPQLDLTRPAEGPQFNGLARARGGELANVLLGLNATAPTLWTMSYEHSYASAVGSEAETHGATFNARFLAGGVGAIGPYTPQEATAYYAAQAPDDVNRFYAGLRVGDIGFGVPPESIRGIKVVDSGISGIHPMKVLYNPFAPLSLAEAGVDHHNALMSDDERVNGNVLKAVQQLLKDGNQK
jgi:hypothetical protein